MKEKERQKLFLKTYIERVDGRRVAAHDHDCLLHAIVPQARSVVIGAGGKRVRLQPHARDASGVPRQCAKFLSLKVPNLGV